MSQPEIAYAAHTATCTFLLDEDGICRRVVTRNKNGKESRVARRCLGAQYVASLDLRTENGLVEMPTIGAALLFARIDGGRVALVKTAPLERFDTVDEVPQPRPSAPELNLDVYEDERLEARTRQVRAVRDVAAVAAENPELSRRYQELLDRAARTNVRREPAPSPTIREMAELINDAYSGDAPTAFVRARPRPGGMLPKRPAVIRGGGSDR